MNNPWQKEIEDALKEAFEKGRREGLAEGYANGCADGYEAGIKDGIDKAAKFDKLFQPPVFEDQEDIDRASNEGMGPYNDPSCPPDTDNH